MRIRSKGEEFADAVQKSRAGLFCRRRKMGLLPPGGGRGWEATALNTDLFPHLRILRAGAGQRQRREKRLLTKSRALLCLFISTRQNSGKRQTEQNPLLCVLCVPSHLRAPPAPCAQAPFSQRCVNTDQLTLLLSGVPINCLSLGPRVRQRPCRLRRSHRVTDGRIHFFSEWLSL